MSQTGLKYTNPFIWEKVEEYILAKLGMEEHKLSEQQKFELESFSKTFHKIFLKKRIQESRNIGQIEQSTWGQNQITIPQSLLGTPEAPASVAAPAASATSAAPATSVAKAQPKFSHSDLTDVMQNNSFSFTDTTNQVKAVRDHILSELALTVEDLDDCLEELEVKIRKFVSQTGSKYKGVHRVYDTFRTKIFNKKRNSFLKYLLRS